MTFVLNILHREVQNLILTMTVLTLDLMAFFEKTTVSFLNVADQFV